MKDLDLMKMTWIQEVQTKQEKVQDNQAQKVLIQMVVGSQEDNKQQEGALEQEHQEVQVEQERKRTDLYKEWEMLLVHKEEKGK